LEIKEVLKNKTLKALTQNFEVVSVTAAKKHILSHQHLYATFYEINIKKAINSKTLIKIKREELSDYGIPQLINKYLKSSV